MLSSVDLASVVQDIQPRAQRSPLAGYEHQRGWGILAYPFDTGHVLALRVSPQNDFAPFASIWHRAPDGAWSIYVDGPRLDTACPRYWGAATDRTRLTDISVEWTGPRDLVVEMEKPRLRWTASMDDGPVARAVDAVSRRLPETVLRSRAGVRLSEWLGDRLFDLGDVTLAPRVPNGQDAIVLTRRLYPVVDGRARFDGEDLGRPAEGLENPTFGMARLPARPVFTVGGGYLTILDVKEYERTVGETRRGPVAEPYRERESAGTSRVDRGLAIEGEAS